MVFSAAKIVSWNNAEGKLAVWSCFVYSYVDFPSTLIDEHVSESSVTKVNRAVCQSLLLPICEQNMPSLLPKTPEVAYCKILLMKNSIPVVSSVHFVHACYGLALG